MSDALRIFGDDDADESELEAKRHMEVVVDVALTDRIRHLEKELAEEKRKVTELQAELMRRGWSEP